MISFSQHIMSFKHSDFPEWKKKISPKRHIFGFNFRSSVFILFYFIYLFILFFFWNGKVNMSFKQYIYIV